MLEFLSNLVSRNSSACLIRHSSFVTRHSSVVIRQSALADAIEEINNKTRGEPEQEADPRQPGQEGHQDHAHANSQNGCDRHPGSAELPRALRLADSKDHNSYADQNKGEQRSDIRQLHDFLDVGYGRPEGNENTGQNRCDVRCPITRMDSAEPWAQQTVAG